jgi:hypothetical protein
MPTTLDYSPYISSSPNTIHFSPYTSNSTFSVNSIIQTIKSWFKAPPKVPVRILDKRVIEHDDDVIQETTKPDKDRYVRLRHISDKTDIDMN